MKGYFRVRHKQCLSLLYVAPFQSLYAANIGTCMVGKGIASLLGCGTWCVTVRPWWRCIHTWCSALLNSYLPLCQELPPFFSSKGYHQGLLLPHSWGSSRVLSVCACVCVESKLERIFEVCTMHSHWCGGAIAYNDNLKLWWTSLILRPFSYAWVWG